MFKRMRVRQCEQGLAAVHESLMLVDAKVHGMQSLSFVFIHSQSVHRTSPHEKSRGHDVREVLIIIKCQEQSILSNL